jgi:8-oxo-dGTP pyrophosphatase MutT (NUDIX family)
VALAEFERDGTIWRCRVGVVAYHRDRVLLNRTPGSVFWFMPGGRLEVGETVEEAAVREIEEETGHPARLIGLRWIVENFFGDDRMTVHEIGFYVEVEAAEALRAVDAFTGDEGGQPVDFAWFPLTELPDLQPAALAGLLIDRDGPIRTVVQRPAGPG